MPPYGGDAPLLGGAGGASAGLGAPGGGEGGGKFSVFNLKRYRMYFNVDTQARSRAQPGKLCTGALWFWLSRRPCFWPWIAALTGLYGVRGCELRPVPVTLLACTLRCVTMKRASHFARRRRQDVLVRMRDSVIGAFRPDFLEKTSDSADLCARAPALSMRVTLQGSCDAR